MILIRIFRTPTHLTIISMAHTLVVLGGPTAVGKTRCGIEVAQHLKSEIISADSRQIYRETSIGTAVPSPEELNAVRHHFIQTVSIQEQYNASRYEYEVLVLLEDLFRRYDRVLMVGGSGLYIKAVCEGIDELPSPDPVLRKKLLYRLGHEGLESLTGELERLDPVSYRRIDLNNHMRVLKALEVSLQTGRPYSDLLSDKSKERPFQILRVALDMDRDLLYRRINSRVDRMMERGLLEEVKRLQHFRECNALKSVGYRELLEYLDGKAPLEEAVDRIKRNTRKFARKQLTWFRKNELYHWFSPDDPNAVIRWIEEQLHRKDG
jgi:tRNA dimethylallyltransferase